MSYRSSQVHFIITTIRYDQSKQDNCNSTPAGTMLELPGWHSNKTLL